MSPKVTGRVTGRGGVLLPSTETVTSPYPDAVLRVFFNYLKTACGIKRSMDFLGFALRFFFLITVSQVVVMLETWSCSHFHA